MMGEGCQPAFLPPDMSAGNVRGGKTANKKRLSQLKAFDGNIAGDY